MSSDRFVQLLTTVLGPGTKQGSSYYNFKCPVCQHKNHRLAIQVVPNSKKEVGGWRCFHCETTNKMKGKSIKSLLKRVNASRELSETIYKLLDIKSPVYEEIKKDAVRLPDEFVSLYKYKPDTAYETHFYDQVLTYLINDRKITLYDILKYNIGMCLTGKYARRIVIPSYDSNNTLNFFVTRSIVDKGHFNYINATVDKKLIIPFESTINWDDPIILVEGPFDMISVKRNVIPLLGKTITDALMKRILDSNVEKIYVCLDADAMENALVHCERLMKCGKEVYFVDIGGKDPNSVGFEHILNVLQTTYPLNFSDLIGLKLRSVN